MNTDEKCARMLLEIMHPLRRRLDLDSRNVSTEYGLSMVQLFALKMIATGACQPSDLARHMLVTLPAATNMCDALVHRGLVSRSRSESDRRVVYLRVTDTGKETLRQYELKLVGGMRDLISLMPAEKQTQLLDGLESLKLHLDEGLEERCPVRSGSSAQGEDLARVGTGE